VSYSISEMVGYLGSSVSTHKLRKRNIWYHLDYTQIFVVSNSKDIPKHCGGNRLLW